MKLTDYLQLTKPRINLLVVVTAFIGLWWGARGTIWQLTTLWTLLGTALAVGSANAFNHYWERQTDALMNRTRDRPLPSGRLSPAEALVFGGVTGIAGLLLLFFEINALASVLALVAIVSYVPLYTMLKPVTSLSTLVGAIPGAIPPVIGWVAVRGEIGFPAVILFFIMFFWQPPHFIALALYLSDDYERAGLAMLPVEMDERAALRQIVVYTVSLLLVSYIPVMMGMTGTIYFVVASVLGITYVGFGLFVHLNRLGSSERWARYLFFYSIVYLPVVLTILVLDRTEGLA